MKKITATLLFLLILFQAFATAQVPGVSILLKEGKWNQALALLEKELDKNPGSWEAHYLIAKTLYLRAIEISKDRRLGKTVREEMAMVEEEAKSALEKKPDNRDARMLLAQALFQQSRFKEAEKEALKLVKNGTKDGGANFLLGEIAFIESSRALARKELKQGKTLREKARTLYQRALSQGADKAKTWHRLGDLAANNGKFKKALTFYSKSLKRNSLEAPHSWLLSIAGSLGKETTKEVQTIYLDAAKARLTANDKKGAGRLFGLAGLFLETAKNWKEAREVHMKALELDKEGRWSEEYRAGWCSFWMNDEENAEKWFLHLVRTKRIKFCDLLGDLGREGKTASAMMHALAAKALNEGRRNDARDLSLLLAIVRGKGDDWNNYAFLCRETGQFENAWKGYQRALERNPTNPIFLNDGALILHYHLKRDLNLAEKMYKKAIKEAKKLLKNPNAKPGARAGAATALRDAANNLRRLQSAKKQKEGRH